MYKLKRCSQCFKIIHVKTIGNKTIVKNACEHFKDKTNTLKSIDNLTIPLTEYQEPIRHTNDIHYCIIHKQPLQFKYTIDRFADLYFCPKCKTLDLLLPTKYIMKWLKKNKINNWQPGSVKKILSPSYLDIKKNRWL